ncbi:hypothetical protein LJR290_007719 [Variovorax sp. LjRoot290]|uniref:hypothetical protein n=1 Tax=unclassified Variovorax TaxID=663243 RepID=UPI003ED12F8D
MPYLYRAFYPDSSSAPPGPRLSDRIATAAILVIVLAAFLGLLGYGLIVVLGIAKEMLVAALTLTGGLVTAVFTYSFQRSKDLELAGVQRARELEATERKTKQENYVAVVTALAPYLYKADYDKDKSEDAFKTAILRSWVVGSEAVVQAMLRFHAESSPESLDRVLYAMREDLMGMGQADRLIGMSPSDQLFPPRPPAEPPTSPFRSREQSGAPQANR